MPKILRDLQRSSRAGRSRPYRPFCGLMLGLLAAVACTSSAALEKPPVDGEKALEHTVQIVGFGPRAPGSNAQKKVGDYIISQLQSFGLETQTDSFQPLTPEGRLEMRNVWGVLEGDPDSIIMLASHYDSKLFEEFEFVGANDGASSSGLLLELARVLARENPVHSTLWFTFFDGEEALRTWTDQDSLYGSRRFLSQLQQNGQFESLKAMILLDLIGGKDLVLHRDLSSTDWLNRLVWSKAAGLGYSEIFRLSGTTAATDDHIPFARAGIPVIDIIDLDYDHWHEETDTIDKISSRSLQIVGEVVLASLPEVEKRLKEAP